MTDRINAYLVVLEHDLRDDDADVVMQAIGIIRGVLEVRPHKADAESVIARAQARGELLVRIQKAMDDYV